MVEIRFSILTCREMSRLERQQFFSAAFPWRRRASFLVFLVSQGYLFLFDLKSIDCESPPQLCDVLFDVGDLHREVCKFL